MSRISKLAEEVFNPGDWVSANASKIMLGLTAGTRFYTAARSGKFRKREIAREDGSKGRPIVQYLLSDLRRYAKSNDIVLGAYMRDWLRMIIWVDNLTEMPTDEEISANVKGSYTMRELVNLIDTRQYRGLCCLDRL